MNHLPDGCDLVIIGGGITGAGIFHETTRMGLSVVLAEQNDFAWGTSSRSSKMIHGGLRYLKEGHFLLTRDAVRERERLLRDAPGLVTPIDFLVPIYKDHGPGRWTLEAGLSIYDLLAQKRQHRFLDVDTMVSMVPFIERKNLIGGYQFADAQVDDARLVLRLIKEGRQAGGIACNYTAALSIDRDDQSVVRGVTLQDRETLETHAIETSAVINATGCWAEALHPQIPGKYHLRPLRGSHLIFPRNALPVTCAVSFMHPHDGRPVFAIPWEGAALVGTTDIDHTADLNAEPTITPEEADYLLHAVQHLFPSLGLSLNQCVGSIAGLRPVVSSGGKRAPSEESREHDIWTNEGLVTVAGGKLTTYRRVALDAVKAVQPFLPPEKAEIKTEAPTAPAEPLPPEKGIDPVAWQRLCGRYGRDAGVIVSGADEADLTPVPGTNTLWAEMPYAARNESVHHLTDLLLRRVRIGLLLADGGKDHMARIEQLCRPVLGWDRSRWRREVKTYLQVRQIAHGFAWRRPKVGIFAGLWKRLKSRLQVLGFRF